MIGLLLFDCMLFQVIQEIPCIGLQQMGENTLIWKRVAIYLQV